MHPPCQLAGDGQGSPIAIDPALDAGVVGEFRRRLPRATLGRLEQGPPQDGRARYVSRVASQSDGRRVHLELTAAGNGFVKYAHRYRQDLIRRAMEDWTESDRGQLAVLLARFTDALRATASTDQVGQA